MFCEVEFLPVGESSKAGDCIVVRYGTEDAYELMVVDGGTLESGEAAVRHLKSEFGDKVYLSHLVLSHPDQDHASGLRPILENIPVLNLWMHVPWLHAAQLLPYFKDKRWTESGLRTEINSEYSILQEIIDLAIARNTDIREPFTGRQIGPFRVLGPSLELYEALVPQFPRTPDPDQDALESTGAWIGKQSYSWLAEQLDKVVAKVQKMTTESWTEEKLKDGGIAGASNESSVILYADLGENRRLLLTADAGNLGLSVAAYHADRAGLPLQAFSFVQVPHHGSRRNVGPTILNRLIGPIVAEGTAPTTTAFISAPKDDDRHPRKIVKNAFLRRGCRVVITQGVKKVHWGGFKPRPGYQSITTETFSPTVEEYD